MFSKKSFTALFLGITLAIGSIGCGPGPDPEQPVDHMNVELNVHQGAAKVTGPAILRVQALLGPNRDQFDESFYVDLDGNGYAFVKVPFGKTYKWGELKFENLRSISVEVTNRAPVGGRMSGGDWNLAQFDFDINAPAASPAIGEFIIKKSLEGMMKKLASKDQSLEDKREAKAVSAPVAGDDKAPRVGAKISI